ncbi:MAG: DSD1 family PLP-dependent enzyme [Planctomycetes bacterium]|nr:DSD1 family PLP-dependent enzyme [Planctomycetota bacterium]
MNLTPDLRDIETPALLIDLDIFEANLERMAQFFRVRPAKLRPHIKTHKTPLIAHKQLAAGAIGITCAKLGEAEVMAHAGLHGILLANQVVGESKIRRLAQLARQTDLIVAADDPGNIREIGRAMTAAGAQLGMILEIDVGMKRCGVTPDTRCVELARLVTRTPGLTFRGIMGYEGHIVSKLPHEFRIEECRKANARLVRARRLIEKAGIPVEIVSAGGTGTYDVTGDNPGITEVQAGSYVFMDHVYHRVRPEFGIALSVLSTIISRPTRRRGVIDGGLKTFSRGFDLPRAKDCPGLNLWYISEEHGKIRLSGKACDLSVGDKVEFYAGHCCEAVNLHDRLYALRGGRLEAVWTIAARGKLA